MLLSEGLLWADDQAPGVGNSAKRTQPQGLWPRAHAENGLEGLKHVGNAAFPCSGRRNKRFRQSRMAVEANVLRFSALQILASRVHLFLLGDTHVLVWIPHGDRAGGQFAGKPVVTGSYFTRPHPKSLSRAAEDDT